MSLSALAPILVLDSGVGGLSVVRALREKLPAERIIYFGDTARVPYGSKSPQLVTRLVAEAISAFAEDQPKQVVLACNTASAVALPELRQRFPDQRISGVIDPGARAAAAAAGRRLQCTIAVIATRATIDSRAYEQAISRRRMKARLLLKATPLLVPLAEECRRGDDPVVEACLEQYLGSLRKHRPDALLLGCTHFPLFKGAIEKTMGPACPVVDSAGACADDVAARLAAAGLLRPALASVFDDGPLLSLFASDLTPALKRVAARFLGEPVERVHLLDPGARSASVPAPFAPRLSA